MFIRVEDWSKIYDIPKTVYKGVLFMKLLRGNKIFHSEI